MVDARTVHALAVDALLDELAMERSITHIMHAALLRQAALLGGLTWFCEHADVLDTLRKLHVTREGLCPECNRPAPCRTRMIIGTG